MQQKHERQIQETKEHYELKMKESHTRIEISKKEVDDLQKEWEETRKQIEEDADREIEQQVNPI